MTKKGIITVIIVIAVIVLIGWILQKNKKANEAQTAIVSQENTGAVAVKTAIVKKNSLSLDFNLNGTFAAHQDLNLLSENAGIVTSILVDEGAKVSKGQTLAHIDDELLDVETETAQA